MPPTPKAVRIKTAAGWQDIALQGAQGPPGPMRDLAVVTFGNITASAAPGTLIADFGTLTFDGEAVTVEVAAGFVDLKTNSNAVVILYDFITGSDVQVARVAYWRQGVTTDAGGQWFPGHFSFRFTPSAGNHRYRLRFQNDGGTAANLLALDAPPNFARIVKSSPIAPASLVNPPPDLNKISIKRPGTAGDSSGFTGALEVYGAVAGDLQQAITPTVNVWWEVEFWTIVRVLDAAWFAVDASMWLDLGVQTSDVLGQTVAPSSRQINHSGTQPWTSVRTRGLFKLEAGKSYLARPVLTPVGGTWIFYHAGAFTGTLSKVVGYW